MMRELRVIAAVALSAAVAIITLGTYVPPNRPVAQFFDYFGDGAEADPNPAGTVSLEGEHNYVNFTLQAGVDDQYRREFRPAAVLHAGNQVAWNLYYCGDGQWARRSQSCLYDWRSRRRWRG